ncbi:MAG: HNH endonuclease [Candidatus Saccharimonadales bacterium]
MAHSTCTRCHKLTPLGTSRCPTHATHGNPSRTKPDTRTNRPTAHQRGLDRAYRINRRIVLQASSTCVLCGRPGADTADHAMPRNTNVNNHLTNLAPAHSTCNYSRGTKPYTHAQSARFAQYQRLLQTYCKLNDTQYI